MRILSYVNTDQVTEAGARALEFAAECGAGHTVMVLGLVKGRRSPPETPLGAEAKRLGVAFRLVLRRFGLDPGALGQMEAIVRGFRPDVYQSHGLSGSLLARPSFSRGIGWQAFVDNEEAAGRGLGSGLAIRMLRRADQVVAASADVVEDLARRGVQRKALIDLTGAVDRTAAILEAAERVRKS